MGASESCISPREFIMNNYDKLELVKTGTDKCVLCKVSDKIYFKCFDYYVWLQCIDTMFNNDKIYQVEYGSEYSF